MASNHYAYRRSLLTAAIASSGTVSGALTLDGLVPVGLVLPAQFTGTAITFQGSVDNVTYQAVHKTDGNALSVTVAQAKSTGFDAATIAALAPWKYIKLVSGSAEGGARSVVVVARPLAA